VSWLVCSYKESFIAMQDDEVMMSFTLSERLLEPQGVNDWRWQRMGEIR
jgi:hypothetical protein